MISYSYLAIKISLITLNILLRMTHLAYLGNSVQAF